MRKDIVFVAIQIILFVAYVFNVEVIEFSLNSVMMYLSLGVAVFGALVIAISILQLHRSLSPFPTPRLNSQLITNGLFGLVRHPIYTGIIVGAIGYGLYRESIWKLIIALILQLLFYFKAKYEEQLLSNRFNEYADYRSKTGRFLPRCRS